MRAEAGDAIAQRIEHRQRQALPAAPETAWSAGTGWCPAAADTPSARAPPAASVRPSLAPPRRSSSRQPGRARRRRRSADCRASSHGLNVLPGLDRLQGALRARPDREALRRHHLLAARCRSAPPAGPPSAAALRRRPASAKPNASTATISRVGSARGIASPSMHAETRAKVAASRANQPVVSEVGACGSMPASVDAAVRRADAVEAAEARRHAHRAAGVGAERGVAQPGGHRGGRARRRAARHAAGRADVHRRAVEGVLAQDAERDLVGDGLADQRRAGIEQRLHRPGMPASGSAGRSASRGCRRRSARRPRRTGPWRRR